MRCKNNPGSGSWILGLAYGSVYVLEEKHIALESGVHEEAHADLGRRTMSVELKHAEVYV